MGENSTRNPGAPVMNASDCLNTSNVSAHDKVPIGSDNAMDNTRRNSSEKPDSAKIRQHVVPRYLRASTGSCHDLCKYGRRHEFEEMARKPLRKGIAKCSLNEKNSMGLIVPDLQKTEKVVGHEVSEVAKKRVSILKPSPETTKFRTSLDAQASSNNKTRLSNSPTKNSSSLYPPEIIKREVVLPSKKVEVPGKEGNFVDTKVSRMSVKHSSSLNLKSVKVEPFSASDNSEGIHGKARRNSGVSTVRKMTASATAKKVLVPSAAPSSTKFSLVKTTSGNAIKDGKPKLSSSLKCPKTIHEVENEKKCEGLEKTLPVIKIETENNALESIPDDCGILVLPSQSSPNSLSCAKFPCPLSHEEDNEEIVKFCGNEAEEVVSDNTISKKVVEVQPANKKHNENNTFESIPDDRLSPKSLSYEEDNQGIKYNSNEADEFVSVKEKRKKIPIMGRETNAALPSSSSSDTSSHASSSSLFPHEEDDQQIISTGSEADEILSDNTVTMDIVKRQPKQNHNKILRKSRSVLSEDKHRSPAKLKFRSGRVLDLKPENNTPRRLKFRRMRVNTNATDDFALDKKNSTDIGSPQYVKENQNKPSRKSRLLVSEDKHQYQSPIRLFRTKKSLDSQSDNNSLRKLRLRRAREHGAEQNKSDSRRRIFKRVGEKNDAGAAELSSRKVTLKHQHEDLQGKRDAQCLLNNVIEETASKLVESRKGKVKALVGAFESVISLQERKPSLRNVG